MPPRPFHPFSTPRALARVLLLLLAVLPLTTGCQTASRVMAAIKGHPEDEAGKPEAAHAQASPAPGASGASGASGMSGASGAPKQFFVPFAYDSAEDQSLGRARAFMRTALVDNDTFVKAHSPAFFKSVSDVEHPRATVVTCADSRVQSAAFSSQPDNDLFTVRNLGNQLGTSEGGVRYGINRLHTPVLLILGHTGCEAVKAAMGDFTSEPESIRRELQHIHFAGDILAEAINSGHSVDPHAEPAPKASSAPAAGVGSGAPSSASAQASAKGAMPHAPHPPAKGDPWAQAVVANVHAQVSEALRLFSNAIAAGELTVVGAVYDPRDDLKQGAGKTVVVNVNGNTDPKVASAFSSAVRLHAADLRASAKAPPHRAAHALPPGH